jgi:hypothetical protein
MRRIVKKSLYIFIGLILSLSLLLSGCESKEPTAQELLTNTVIAMQKVSSYTLDYDMAMDMEVTGGENAIKMTMGGVGTGAMDVSKQKMQMTMDMDVEIPGAGTSQMTMTMAMGMYLVEGWLYTKMTIPGAGVQWTKMRNPDEISQDQMAQLLVLMESATETTMQGTEKVNGIDCYILEVVPDMNALWQWAMSQQGSNYAGEIDLSEFDMSKIIKSFGLKYWITKKDYQIIKAEVEMEMDASSETVGVSAEEYFDSMTMLINMTMTFSDYNKLVNIQLPEEALDAKEISTP